ncbi:MAG: 4-hydroxy-tetrahydrodipicolinate synthase [Fimbriimonadaceae bacterium]|nr:4-hydroxy-tetrahydrodipicolinate synthase [Fimbriimonadaceae bacterium]
MTKFRGCASAIVTPFRADGSLDEATLRKLVKRQIDSGMDFVVPCGTTGESPTLTHQEHLRVVEITVEECNGKVPVLGGAGGYNTAEVISLANELKRIGVDGILSVTPYYNKPTQEGLYAHYKAIAEGVDLPIVLYSVQSRTGVNIEAPTVLKLAEIPNIVAIKEASANIGQIATICAERPEGFGVLSGDDAITLAMIGHGAEGLVSVAGNEIPKEMADLVHLALAGDFAGARAIQKKFILLMNVNFAEASPGPVKYVMSKMGLLEPVIRLPLVLPRPDTRAKLDAVMAQVGIG